MGARRFCRALLTSAARHQTIATMINQSTQPKYGATSRRLPLSKFARNLAAAWKALNLPQNFETVLVAFSGGADSTALLLSLKELVDAGKLRIRLMAAHLDHGLRDDSVADARWVRRLGNDMGLKIVVGK